MALERQGKFPAERTPDAAVACEEGAEGAADALCRRLIASGKRVTLAAEYGEGALSDSAAPEKYYVAKEGVRRI